MAKTRVKSRGYIPRFRFGLPKRTFGDLRWRHSPRLVWKRRIVSETCPVLRCTRLENPSSPWLPRLLARGVINSFRCYYYAFHRNLLHTSVRCIPALVSASLHLFISSVPFAPDRHYSANFVTSGKYYPLNLVGLSFHCCWSVVLKKPTKIHVILLSNLPAPGVPPN